MIDRITIGAASLMGALVAGTVLVRWAVCPPVRERMDDTIEIPLAGLKPWWPEPVTPPLGTQAFRVCAGCRGEVPVVVHGDAHRCDRGHVTISPAGGDLR